MKIRTLACCSLLLANLAIGQDTLAVNTGLGSSGLVCDPYSCTPTQVDALPGTRLQLVARGSVGAPRFALVSMAPTRCTPIPGIGGELSVQPDLVAYPGFSWGRIYVSSLPGQPNCGGWLGFSTTRVDGTVPSGTVFRLQTLSARTGLSGLELNFSNPVEVTIR